MDKKKKEQTDITAYALKPDEMPSRMDERSGRSTAIGYMIIGAAMANPGKPIIITDHKDGDDKALYQRIKNRTIHQGMKGFTFMETSDHKQFVVVFDLARFEPKRFDPKYKNKAAKNV